MSMMIERETDEVVFTFDGVTTATPQVRATISQHPQEEGTDVTDHVQRLPDTYQIVCIETATPALAGDKPTGEARLLNARAFLSSCIGVPCTITVPRMGQVRQALLGTFSCSYDNVGRLEFSMTWQAAQFATPEFVTIPAPVAAVEPQMSDEQNAGQQASETVDEPEAERSLLASMLGL